MKTLKFKKGDKVHLITKDQSENEIQNWIDKELSCPKIGDTFTVQFDCNSADEFVTLEELLLSHPKDKFESDIVRPDGMSDEAFRSMVARNKITPEKIEALRVSLERGKAK
jgi:hypothetical protein